MQPTLIYITFMNDQIVLVCGNDRIAEVWIRNITVIDCLMFTNFGGELPT